LHLHTCEYIFCRIFHHPYPFSPPLLLPTGAYDPSHSQDSICSPSYSLILWKKKEKRYKEKHECFYVFEIKIVIQGVSLWYFHAYTYYIPNCLIKYFVFSLLNFKIFVFSLLVLYHILW
jgi:hypothetical protein